MLKCSCYHCPNRQIGCHKFCPDYRKYRRELEAMEAAERKEKENSKACEKTYFRNNNRKK